jgi:mannitol 2-dehydrogenase
MSHDVRTARLGAATVRDLGGQVAVPGYDRSDLTVGIVHIGTGAFHRSHQAAYLDQLLNAGQALNWAICGIDLLPADRHKAEVFARQDGLYTLMVKHADGGIEPRVIGALADYVFAPDAPELAVSRLTDPRTRIVTLTVTEGGYNVHPVSGEFDTANPAVQADLRGGAVPTTVFGFVTEALRRRRADHVPPFTVASCDNVQANGDLARRMFAAFADLAEPGLGVWIREQVAFPNSMVDRITPATTADDIARLRANFGIDDGWPVVCEPFSQWVLEDSFPSGRPPWESCGVQLVSDVTTYEQMKLRLLNVGHQALAYAGYLAGYRYVHEVAADPVFAEFVTGYMQAEARPTLASVPGADLDTYIGALLERFSNPAIGDTLARLCAFSSDRIPRWLLPVIRDNLAAGGEVARSAAIVASWARYAEGTDESGQRIEVVDRLRDEVVLRAAGQHDDPLSFVRNDRLFGDLAGHDRFAADYLRALASFRRVGARATLESINADLARAADCRR